MKYNMILQQSCNALTEMPTDVIHVVIGKERSLPKITRLFFWVTGKISGCDFRSSEVKGRKIIFEFKKIHVFSFTHDLIWRTLSLSRLSMTGYLSNKQRPKSINVFMQLNEIICCALYLK